MRAGLLAALVMVLAPAVASAQDGTNPPATTLPAKRITFSIDPVPASDSQAPVTVPQQGFAAQPPQRPLATPEVTPEDQRAYEEYGVRSPAMRRRDAAEEASPCRDVPGGVRCVTAYSNDPSVKPEDNPAAKQLERELDSQLDRIKGH